MILRIIIFFFLLQQGFSQVVIKEEDSNNSTIGLLSQASIYTEESDTKGILDIQNESFGPIADTLIKEPYQIAWVKFTIENNTPSKVTRKLRLFDGWCERIEIYSRPLNSQEKWNCSLAGYMIPEDSLDLPFNRKASFTPPYMATVELEAGKSREYYIKYWKVYRPFLELNLNLQSLEQSAEEELQETRGFWATAAFMGILAFFAAFHLLYYFIVKDIAYLYYALFGFSMIFGATVMDDYLPLYYQLFYQGNTSLQPWVYIVAGSASVILYIQFTRAYLNSAKRFYYFDKFLLASMLFGLTTTTIILINFYFKQRQFSPYIPFAGFVALVALVYITQIVLIIRKGQTSDMFLLLGISLLLICLVPSQLKELFLPNEYYGKTPILGSLSVLQLGTILELLSFALGLSYRTKRLKQEKLQLESMDKLKSKFFTDISHEFRTPLMLIKGPLQQIRQKLITPADQSLAELAEKHSDKLLEMVNQILDLSKIEANSLKLQPVIVDLIVLAKGLFFSFESLAVSKQIELKFESKETSILMDIDIQKMETILSNLIGNAVKYTNEGGKISLSITRAKGEAVLALTDTGIGIAPKDIDKVFDRFFQKGDESTSFGIGLALTRELVQLHHGSIKVTSQEGQGSTFVLRIPITTNSETSENKSYFKRTVTAPSRTINNKIAKNIGHSHVLVVEDNTDVRIFIEQQLAENYKVSVAENGVQGIKNARNLQPDIIISDVMMPGKDGFGLTHALKNDILTSHIPIILLTAKAGQTDKMEGLSAGADAYLTKPVDFKELEVRIENLIKLRRELRTRFADKVEINPSEVSTNSVDTKFMEKLVAIIEKNMSDESFSVEQMSEEIGISSRQLNRKLQSLINQTPIDLLKSMRLQRAADLISQNAGSIADIAFQTGFRSAAYFSTSFKNYFGKSPKSYKNQT